jgi:hypothetical protein
MIRLSSSIITDDTRTRATRLLRIPATYIAPKRFHQTDGLVADVDPVLGRGSSTLSRDTRHRSDIAAIRWMTSGEP